MYGLGLGLGIVGDSPGGGGGGGGGGVANSLVVTVAESNLATVGSSFTSATPAISGGTGSGVTYALAASPSTPNTLAAMGLALNAATGVISGATPAVGYYWGLMTATDSAGNTGFTPITISCGNAATTVAPSGDTTGAADVAAINAVTSAGGRAALNGTYYLNASLVLASNSGLIGDVAGVTINLVAASNSNMVKNANRGSQTRTDTNVVVWANGTMSFNGLFGAQTRPGNGPGLCALHLISVNGATVKGATVVGEMFFTGAFGCTNLDWNGVIFGPSSKLNQDGFDIGPGCSYVAARHLTGSVGDDVFSIFAKSEAGTGSMLHGTPWAVGADVSNIYPHDNFVAARADNYFRLQCGDGFKLSKIYGYRNFNDTSLSANLGAGSRTFLELGESKYTNTPPAITDWSDINFDGAKGFKTIISNDTNAGDVHVKNVELTIALTALITTLEGNSSSYAGTGNNITVDGVTDTSGANHGSLVSFPSGAVESNISVKNFAVTNLSRINSSVAAITGLTIQHGVITNALNPLWNASGAATGLMDDVTLTNQVANTANFATACGLVLTATALKINPFETVVPSPVSGSVATFTNGTSPAGVYVAQGGVYAGNGTSWVLQGSAANVPYPDAHVFYHDTFTDTPALSLLSHTADLGGGYTGLTGAANTTAPKINAAGDGGYAGNSNNGIRSNTISNGLNQVITAVLEFKGALSDTTGFVFCASGSAQTYYWLRWNTASLVWQLYSFVATVPTNLGVDSADTFASGQKTIVVTTTVDNLVTPTTRNIKVSVGGVQIMNVNDTSILTAGYPGFKPNTTQTSTTGRHLVDLKAETI